MDNNSSISKSNPSNKPSYSVSAEVMNGSFGKYLPSTAISFSSLRPSLVTCVHTIAAPQDANFSLPSSMLLLLLLSMTLVEYVKPGSGSRGGVNDPSN